MVGKRTASELLKCGGAAGASRSRSSAIDSHSPPSELIPRSSKKFGASEKGRRMLSDETSEKTDRYLKVAEGMGSMVAAHQPNLNARAENQ